MLEIRRLYLGYAITNKHVNQPLINRSSEKLYDDFLKNVLHVTRNGYRRKIVRRVFRQGAKNILELYSMDSISKHLQFHPNDVVFVSRDKLEYVENAKVIERLW